MTKRSRLPHNTKTYIEWTQHLLKLWILRHDEIHHSLEFTIDSGDLAGDLSKIFAYAFGRAWQGGDAVAGEFELDLG